MRGLGNSFRLLAILLALACLSACAPAARPRPPLSPAAAKEAEVQREIAAQTYYERLERLNAVGFALVAANEPLCRQRGKTRPTIGLTADYFTARDSREWLAALCKFWGVGQGELVVTGVVPGGPAARAGVQRGDVIRSAGGKPFDSTGKRVNAPRALDGLSALGPATLELVRAGRPVTVTIPAPVAICASDFRVTLGDAVNAYADGASVRVTYGLMNLFIQDEDLAVVLGHELAHNILGHVWKDASGKTLQKVSPEAESEADAVGLYFTARAGFDIKNAPSVWRRLAAQHPESIRTGGAHPSSATRFVDLEAVRDEILMRQAAGLALIPRPRVAPGQ